ncbi:MAG: hypothetical protein EA376_04570 [Phycisphaeraceae bacterium]|nr:MAG: hypothetical protein EA376_04570 [Phycisphaeraceae bacterium]
MPEVSAEGDDRGVTRPSGAQRVVRIFDFEERDIHMEPVPLHWVRAVHNPPQRERPGFPRWNESHLDNTVSHSGEWSVKLPTRGGSTSLRLTSGVAPAIPGADYVVSVMVRTEGLQHAKAQLAARLIDSRRGPIDASERRSRMVRTDGAWQELSVELSGGHDDAAWIQIDLELLQPEHQALVGGFDSTDAHHVMLEDVSGAAWFDDVVIRQNPRLSLRAGEGANIAIAPDSPGLITTVKDLTGESLRGHMVVHDIKGRTVDETTFDASWAGRPTVWRPTLREYGWHRAHLTITSESGELANQAVDFVWTPERRRSTDEDRGRFGVIIEELDADHRTMLPELLRLLGTGAANLSLPALGLRADGAGEIEPSANEMMQSLLDARQEITLTLDRTPDAEDSAHDGGFDLLFRESSETEPAFENVVSRYGQRVRRWQMGRTGQDFAFWERGILEGVERVERVLSRLAPEPIVTLPWSATLAISPEAARDAALTVSMPTGITPDGVVHFGEALPLDADMTLVIEPTPIELVGERAAAIDLFRRVVQAWRFQPARIAIRAPWRRGEGEEPELLPTAELAVYRQLVEHLSGRRAVALLPIAEGAIAIVMQGRDSDAIIAWNEWATPEDAVIRAYLAEGAVQVIDPFGNMKEVAPSDGLHRIALTETPVIIEGVDVHLAQFRAGFHVEPPFVHSSARKHDLELVIQNPWPGGLSGTLRIVEPEHWRISPRVHNFNINPGETLRLPFETSFSVGEEAGQIPIGVDFNLIADRRYPTIRLAPTVEIGLPHVQLTSSYAIEDNGDLTVTLVVSNTGDRPLTMRSFAMAPGFARQEAPVSELQPARTTVKRFTFRGGAERLSGESIRSGLIEVDGLGRLNQTLKVD